MEWSLRVFLARLIFAAALASVIAACGNPTEDERAGNGDVPTETRATPPGVTAPLPPSTADEPMILDGTAWVDARPATSMVVEAQVAGERCSAFKAGGSTDSNLAFFTLVIPQMGSPSACSAEGAEVALFIDGRRANESVSFAPNRRVKVDVTVGGAFAQYVGTVEYTGNVGAALVVPFVGTIRCGYQLNDFLGAGPRYDYRVVVFSDEVQAGCADTGKPVTLHLMGAGGSGDSLAEIGTYDWAPGSTTTNIPR